MDSDYDLPTQVGDAVKTLRRQGVAVQLLVGGEVSRGWSALEANPKQAAAKAIELMKKVFLRLDSNMDPDRTRSSYRILVAAVRLRHRGGQRGGR
eukprot:3026973-Prymnesium_polylepis.1